MSVTVQVNADDEREFLCAVMWNPESNKLELEIPTALNSDEVMAMLKKYFVFTGKTVKEL